VAGQPVDNRKSDINTIVAKINKAAKRTIIGTADKLRNSYFLRRPSGIMQLDIDTGGGLPAGGLACVSGLDGAGKTHLMYKYMAMHQRMYGDEATIALACTEAPIDHFYLRKLGIIVSVPDEAIEERTKYRKDLGFAPFTKEEIKEMKRSVGCFYPIVADYMEQMLDVVLELVSCDLVNIIGIDSITAAQPKAFAELEKIEEEARQGAHATALKKFLIDYFPMTVSFNEVPNKTTIIMTQQMVSNRKKSEAPSYIQKYLPDSVPSMGSHSLKHGKLIDILLTNGAGEKEKNETGKKETKSKMLEWEIKKGKAGVHEGVRGESEFIFDEGGIDNARTILASGIKCGFIQEASGLITILDPKTKEPSPKVNRMPAKEFIAMLNDDPRFDAQVRAHILAEEGIQCRFV